MPPSKVCPQCDAVAPIRLKVCKSCQHVFRAKRQIEHTLPARAMKQMRVAMLDGVKSVKMAKDKLQKACKRAAESSKQTLHRQQKNQQHMASMRAAESSEQTWHRRLNDREYKASMRAAESSKQTLHRQQNDREYKASMRAAKKVYVSTEQAIVSFHSNIKNGPSFVCTCCHRLMYRKSVVTCNPAKYSKCSNDLLKCVFSADLRYVCDKYQEQEHPPTKSTTVVHPSLHLSVIMSCIY